jgi:hypothetical protein
VEGDEEDEKEDEKAKAEEGEYFTTQSSTGVLKFSIEDENRRGKVGTGIEKEFWRVRAPADENPNN